MSQSLKMRHVLTVACVGLILIFQNCAQTDSNSSGDFSSFEAQLPFAYTAKLDTISYMSCSNMADNPPSEKRGYFSIRAGAYGTCTGTTCAPFTGTNAGLGITEDFRSAIKYYDNNQRRQIFSLSSKSSNTLLSLSVRSSSAYQNIWKEGNLNAGEELDAMLPALDSEAVAGPLGASLSGQLFNYFPGSQSKRLMEGSLRYYNYENTAKLTRDSLNSREALLVLGYSESTDVTDTKLKVQEQDSITGNSDDNYPSNRAYGLGYFLSFSLPSGYSSGERRVLSPSSGVQEIELLYGQQTNSSWDCSTSYQFMIIRPEDKAAGKVICNATVDRYSSSTEQAALNAIRRVLRVEDWFVDVTNRCIMPKRTGDYCYGDLQGRAIQYAQSTCVNGSTTMCPHFVSVCIRR